MKHKHCARVLSSLVMAGALAACSDMTPIKSTVVPPSTTAGHARNGSWMAPDTSSEDLLYVTQYQDTVYVFSFPGGTLEGQFTDQGYPGDLCTDAKGDVFIPGYGTEDILEYAHGGTTPIATFISKGYHPAACSIDPATGDLAVARPIADASNTSGDIAIFKPGHTTPSKRITNPRMNEPRGCAYDTAGNLYTFGLEGSDTAYGVLPAGKDYIYQLTLSPAVTDPGEMQWDGTDLAVLDRYHARLVRYSINRRAGTKISVTQLKTAGQGSGFWIAGNDVVAPKFQSRDLGIWMYPQGGKPIAKIATTYGGGSVVVSVASSRR